MLTFKTSTKIYLGLTIVLLCISLFVFRSANKDKRPNIIKLSNITKLPNITKCPNIILISIDTLRADRLDVYGYNRKTSSSITAMASKGVLFKHAISQAPWTLPSLASLHTSMYPSEHNANNAHTRLSDKTNTLAEVLNKLGYYTIGVVSNIFATKKYGMSQGYEVFDASQNLGPEEVTSEALSKLAVKYIKKSDQRPFFLWLHYFDPHNDFVRHPEYGFASGYSEKFPDKISRQYLLNEQKSKKSLDYVNAVYDEEIAYTDHWVGWLSDQIKSMGLEKTTVTILTADHGEYFMERGRFLHGKDVYKELIDVPLVITGAIDKKLRGTVVDQTVEISSIPKTIMKLVDFDKPVFGGKNLLALIGKKPEPDFVFTEGCYAWGTNLRKKAVIFKRWKLIYNFDDETYELYHLDTDKNERKNRWNDNDTELKTLKKLMKNALNQFPNKNKISAVKVKINEKEKELLRSLGYVN